MSDDSENDRHRSRSRRHNGKSDRQRGKRHRHRDDKRRQQGKRKSRARRGGSMTIAQFCQRHWIGHSTFYDLCKRGLGPRLMRIGRAVRISFEADRDWVKKMEAEVVAPVPALADVTLEEDIEGDTSEPSDEQNDVGKPSDKAIPRERSAKHKKPRNNKTRKRGDGKKSRRHRRDE
jgi:hypothetical protein